MRDHDLRGLVGRDVRVQDPQDADRDSATDKLGDDEGGHRRGGIPAKVSENILPTLIAGLAKPVELVKK